MQIRYKFLLLSVAPELDGSSTNQTGVEDNAAGDRILRFRSPLSNTDVVIAKYDTDLPIFDSELLDDLMPRFIVIYDPNSSFVRQVEMYKAKYPGLPLRVYFLVYANSVEEQKYLTTIKQEKEAFESLIRTKSVSATFVSIFDARFDYFSCSFEVKFFVLMTL
jgi:hypothetical protein